MELLDWIDIEKLDWDQLSFNPNAIELLRENQDKINWCYLSSNPNAIDLLKENQDKITNRFLLNPNATELLQQKIWSLNWLPKYYLLWFLHFLTSKANMDIDKLFVIIFNVIQI